jgi:hypothetical protein
MTTRNRQILGWIAVSVATALACFWAFWGIIENFHEGWYRDSVLGNIGLMLAQYLSPMLLFVAMGLIAIGWPRLGAPLHILVAVGAGWFFRNASLLLIAPFIVGPLVLLGFAYWFGRPRPLKLAIGILIGLPLFTVLAFGAEPALRVAHRIDDGNRGPVHIEADGVNLIWAPEGPGWPRDGVDWNEARRRCRHLTADGRTLADEPQNIWRLPTIDEAVRSMQRHGQNCEGRWDSAAKLARYTQTPDKESPLWDVYSPVIYWWTADEARDRDAYIIVYDGKVWPHAKHSHWGYLGFRAVKDATQ